MSFGPQTAGNAVVPKFDMQVYTSVLTPDEVKNLVAKYAIPLDLYLCVPPSSLTMNKLPVDKIVGHHPVFKDGEGNGNTIVLPLFAYVIRLLRLLSLVLFFLLHLLRPCLNSLSSLWPKVCVLVKERLLWTMRSFPNIVPPLPSSAQIPKKTDHQRVVEYENERVLVAKRKAQAAKDRAVGKISAAKRTSRRTKKKKSAPISFALDDSKEDDSTRTGSGTHHSSSPLNIIIPDDANPRTGGGGVASELVRYEDGDADHGLENAEDGNEADSPPATHHPGSQRSHRFETDTHTHSAKVHHDVGDESRGEFLFRWFGSSDLSQTKPWGDGADSSFRAKAAQPSLFVSAWKLRTHSILNDVESCRDMMIHLATPTVRAQQSRLSDHQALQRSWFELGRGVLAQIDLLQWYEALSDDYRDLYDSHRSCRDVSDRLTETQNQLVDVTRGRNKLADDHKHLQQEHLGCAGKEVGLVDKLDVVEKEKDDLLDKNR
uniref:Uncharacterized protein n=1 Tax=Tanacetum cinerariifolium TaxID=118510 RepID=A0A6L2NMX4_TANCI|nr:hypothetical protein [Tanacetum cinerariifolium]